MEQQTSVEWLIKIYLQKGKIDSFDIEQAKEKHKEETMDSFQAGKWDWSEHTNNGKHSMDPAEYYNETFKK
jgi:hypothetical protein